MLGTLILLFTIVPALEFFLLFKIGSQIGATNTFTIILITGVFGAYLAKSQGVSIINKVQSQLTQGSLPAKEILHGFIVFGGGLLLLTPGFITDILGFCMVIPGTRHLLVEFLMLYFKRGIASGTIRFMSSTTKGPHQQPPRDTSPESENRQHQVDSNTFEADFKERKKN